MTLTCAMAHEASFTSHVNWTGEVILNTSHCTLYTNCRIRTRYWRFWFCSKRTVLRFELCSLRIYSIIPLLLLLLLLLPFNGLFSRTTRVSQYQKVKPIWILLEQEETVSGSGISWAICKSALRSRQITTPAFHHSVFYRPVPFVLPNRVKALKAKALPPAN